jgi:osmotically-inducible protein OsmY
MKVTTQDGVVVLEGTVPNQAAKDRALEVARQTEGVVQVIDRLQVERSSGTSSTRRPAGGQRR